MIAHLFILLVVFIGQHGQTTFGDSLSRAYETVEECQKSRGEAEASLKKTPPEGLVGVKVICLEVEVSVGPVPKLPAIK